MESSRRLGICFALLLVGSSVSVTGCGSEEAETEPAMAPPVTQPGFDPFCGTRPKYEFCEDFDTQALPGAFDEHIVERGEMVITDEDAASLPQSLRVTVESGGTGILRHQFEAGGKLRLFGMLYVSALGEGDVEIGAFSVGDYRVAFGVGADGQLWAYDSGSRFAGEGTLPVGKWASFRWDVNLYEDGTGTAKLRFGNDFIVNTDLLTPPAGAVPVPMATVGLSEATGRWSMRFDNLTVDVGDVTN